MAKKAKKQSKEASILNELHEVLQKFKEEQDVFDAHVDEAVRAMHALIRKSQKAPMRANKKKS